MTRRGSSPGRLISQQGLEALSGRYATAGGRSHWDIRFQGVRFQALYRHQGKWALLYDGELNGARIIGRIHHGSRSICRRSPTTMLFGKVDLDRKSFEISWGDYDIVQLARHKKCVPAISRRKWTRSDRL